MNDNYVSKASALAILFWGISACLVLVVWVAALMHLERRLLTAAVLTAIMFIAITSVWQIRLYIMRLCALIRVSSGLQSPDAELHTIGRG